MRLSTAGNADFNEVDTVQIDHMATAYVYELGDEGVRMLSVERLEM